MTAANYSWACYRARCPGCDWWFPVSHPWWRRRIRCKICGARFRPCDSTAEMAFAGPLSFGRPRGILSPELRGLRDRFPGI